MKALDIVAAILLVVGGLNWGLIGAFNFNFVTYALGTDSLAHIVYILVGLAAIYRIFQWKSIRRRCCGGK